MVSLDIVKKTHRKHYDIYAVLEDDPNVARPTLERNGKVVRVVESLWISETRRRSAKAVVGDVDLALRMTELPADLVAGGVNFLVAPIAGKIGILIDGLNLEVSLVEKGSKPV